MVRENPKVSIIIPVYNGSNFVRQAIEAALGQSYENKEVIVVNDGSNDGEATDAIVREYADRVRYFTKPNGGVSSALNLGISKMEGEYFSWLSHDDSYAPNKIRDQVELLRSCKREKVIALCGGKFIDGNSQKIRDGQSVNRAPLEDRRVYAPLETLKLMLHYGTFNGCALLIPKAAFDECGGFDERLRYNQDSMMWYKIFLHGYSMVYGAEADVYSRIHGAQLTQNGNALYHRDCETMCDTLLPMLLHAAAEDAAVLYEYAFNNAKYNNAVVVRRCIEAGRKGGLLSPVQIVKLRLLGGYGKVRPWIRKVYFLVFRRIRTR